MEPPGAEGEEDNAADQEPVDPEHQVVQRGATEDDAAENFDEVCDREDVADPVDQKGHVIARKYETGK